MQVLNEKRLEALSQNLTYFPDGEVNFLLDGPQGHLEILTLSAKEPEPKGVGVICHPHPLKEGSMHNKVVHTLSRAFQRQGLHSIRFNFRGVGKSEGQFGNSIGEIEDLMAVLAWADQVLPQVPLWLAGFSFGAYIAASGAAQHTCQQLFSIAPAVTHQPYDTLGVVNCPWVVIQGEQDEVIDPQAVFAWFARHQQRQKNMRLLKMPNATHFFHGELIPLRTLVEEAFVEPAL